ncbi:MAG: 3-deoxy-D-manno-octulosonic acid transferase [Desulfobacula sp.]|nr:3-deoxy-D-manno-octulosonic acid transferase [Desulfobacula sp.]
MKVQKIILNLYNLAWKTILFFLKKSSAFKDSYESRISQDYFKKVDIWLHGASIGEAFVAIEIIKHFNPEHPLKILYTATTSQGLVVMESYCSSLKFNSNIECSIQWFPFDMPESIEKIILKTKPGIMVILETELWPGHLYMLKKHQIKTIIINARLSKKSYSRYLKTRFIWEKISPGKIVATSKKDARRYEKIMGRTTKIGTMPNIKFDSILLDENEQDLNGNSHLKTILPSDISLSILASIRKEEEPHMGEIITYLFNNYPDQVIAVFPKHIQRMQPLIEQLEQLKKELGFKLEIRSKISSKVDKKTIILWDTFGELKFAYAFAVTAFVGGSLEPLGGQNFLEPLAYGTQVVTGPHLNSFKWVDKEIFESKLVFKAKNASQVGKFMVETLKNPPNKASLGKKGAGFIKQNQGGTRIAVKLIKEALL